MNFKTFLFTFCCLAFSINAAAPATHVYFAQLWMDTHPTEDQNALLAGTLFPDIRYLGTIKRNQTHERGVTLKLILETNDSFKEGMRLHVYLDEERERFVKKSGITSSLKAIPKDLQVLFLKTLEDEILWNRLHTDVTKALTFVSPEEIAQGVAEDTVIEWHEKMIDYFHQKPSIFLKEKALAGQGFLSADQKTAEAWSLLLPLYAKKKTFILYVDNLIEMLSAKIAAAQ